MIFFDSVRRLFAVAGVAILIVAISIPAIASESAAFDVLLCHTLHKDWPDQKCRALANKNAATKRAKDEAATAERDRYRKLVEDEKLNCAARPAPHIGMSIIGARETSWGRPYDTSSLETAGGTRTVYDFSQYHLDESAKYLTGCRDYGRALIFENGVLTAIQR